MRNLSSRLAARQAGFTMIELVIVIIVIGILAAVAIPSLTSTQDQARLAVQHATLGALKSSWSAVYATTKTTPTCAQVATQMADPICTANAGGTAITCPGVLNKAGDADASFTCGTLTSSAGLTCGSGTLTNGMNVTGGC